MLKRSRRGDSKKQAILPIDDLLHMVACYVTNVYSGIAGILNQMSKTALRKFPLHHCEMTPSQWLQHKQLNPISSPRYLIDAETIPKTIFEDLQSLISSMPYLKTLKFHQKFNKSLINIVFPESLQSLEFGKKFNQSLVNLSFPYK